MSPRCPRCDYDLSGAVAGWGDRCPLAGTCAECGLELSWPRVLRTGEHPWLFEYHWRRRPLRRLATTWLNALSPKRFWERIRLTDPVRLRPVALVVGSLALLTVLAAYAFLLVARYQLYQSYRGVVPGVVAWRAPWGYRSWPQFMLATAWHLIEQALLMVPGLLVCMVAVPLAFALLPHTLGRARVRPAHIVRIWLYSLLMPITVAGTWALGQAVLWAIGLGDVARALNPWWLAHAHARSIANSSPFALAPWDRPLLVLGDGWPGMLLIALMTAWQWWWWLRAARAYLRLPEARRVVLAAIGLAGLAGVTVQLWSIVL